MTRKQLLPIFVAVFAFLAAAGGSGAALDPGDHEFSLTHKQLRRSYLVHVPPQAAAGKPLPVVLNYHGGGGNARNQKSYSRMDETAAREGFIVVYPNGTGGIGDRLLGMWIAHNACPTRPQVSGPISGKPGAKDATHTATRYTYGPCRNGTEVVL